MEESEFGKWIHAAFTGASFAYFIAVIDKVDLIISSRSLMYATLFFALALILNSIWAIVYYGFNEKINIEEALSKYWILRRFNSLSQWSFIFATIMLVYFVVDPVMKKVI